MKQLRASTLEAGIDPAVLENPGEDSEHEPDEEDQSMLDVAQEGDTDEGGDLDSEEDTNSELEYDPEEPVEIGPNSWVAAYVDLGWVDGAGAAVDQARIVGGKEIGATDLLGVDTELSPTCSA